MEATSAQRRCTTQVNAQAEDFERLYDRHYDEIHAYCARRAGFDSARDLTADVFAVVWRRIEDVPVEAERPWLYGVARGVVRNAWRSSSRRSNLVDRLRRAPALAAAGPEAGLVRQDDGEPIRRALARLRPSDQEILRLAAWEELSGPEIAIVLDLSLSAAQQRLSRAKRRLAKALAEQGSVSDQMEGGETS